MLDSSAHKPITATAGRCDRLALHGETFRHYASWATHAQARVVKLPGGERAVVQPEKIRDYLLSPMHPVGRFKSAFFVALGYRVDRWQWLQRDLLEIARTSDAAMAREPTPFGVKYEVRATLTGPMGRQAELLTVWILPLESDSPRFGTAFPV